MLCLTDPEGKREYDESLGRSPAETTEDEPRTTLQYLVSKGIIKRAQVAEIEHFRRGSWTFTPGCRHTDEACRTRGRHACTRDRAASSLCGPRRHAAEDTVLDQVPRRVIKKFSCLPLFEDRGRLLVVCIDEPSMQLEDEIRLRFGMPMRAVLAVPRSVNQAIAKYYAPGMREEASGGEPEARKAIKGRCVCEESRCRET